MLRSMFTAGGGDRARRFGAVLFVAAAVTFAPSVASAVTPTPAVQTTPGVSPTGGHGDDSLPTPGATEHPAEGAETGEHGEGGGLQITPLADELIPGTIAFFVLLFVLLKFAFPKLKKGLAARAAAIQGQLEQAERTRRDADQVLEQYRAQVAEARGEGQRIIDEAKRTAESMRQEIVQRAEREAAEILQRAQADAAGERERAMQALRATVGDLSITLAGRVIEQELTTTEAHRALIDRAIAELAGSTNGKN